MATMFKSDLPKRKKMVNRTQSKARAARRRKQEAVKREVYIEVDARDGGACRCCGVTQLLQRHHIAFRSQGGKHETANVVTLCMWRHDAVHQHQMDISGNADRVLTFTTVKESPCPS